VNDDEAEEDEKDAAMSTIVEALFPSKHNGELGIDLEKCEQFATPEVRKVIDEMNVEEATFAERLQGLMDAREMTQADLAKAIGVGQSAIAMMLSRNCRPQRRTVTKIATALQVSVEDLWPGF